MAQFSRHCFSCDVDLQGRQPPSQFSLAHRDSTKTNNFAGALETDIRASQLYVLVVRCNPGLLAVCVHWHYHLYGSLFYPLHQGVVVVVGSDLVTIPTQEAGTSTAVSVLYPPN